MHQITKNKVGIVFASVFGLVHLVWALMVASNVAQAFLDFIYKIHMIKPVFIVDDFNLSLSIVLIAVTAIIGYVVGYVSAAVWNYLHR